MRRPVFTPEAWEDFTEWARDDLKIVRKIIELLDAATETPFTGIGKPEPLKYSLRGCWSRRITQEHRLVYEVTDETIIVLACKYHY